MQIRYSMKNSCEHMLTIQAYQHVQNLESLNKVYGFPLFFTKQVFNDIELPYRKVISEIALIKQSIPVVREGLTERSKMSDCHRGMKGHFEGGQRQHTFCLHC